jgi:peptide/nickel transport system permease protein
VYPPKSPFVVGFILAIDNWPGLARSLRSQVLTIREESYIEAARAMDIPTRRIVGRDVISPLMPYIVINGANAARGVIFESVGLYFLGVLPFTTQNWGVMMNLAYKRGSAMANPSYAGHWLYVPMVAIILFSLGFILFAQGMDRVFNPRLRARHAKTADVEEEEV